LVFGVKRDRSLCVVGDRSFILGDRSSETRKGDRSFILGDRLSEKRKGDRNPCNHRIRMVEIE